MDHEFWGPLFKAGYTLMAACAGAVTALSFLKWQEMRWSEIVLTLFVGFSFAIFVTPWAALAVFGPDLTPQSQAGLTYIMGCGVHSIMPFFIRKVRKMLGAEEAA
jgi:hypothetical protein